MLCFGLSFQGPVGKRGATGGVGPSGQAVSKRHLNLVTEFADIAH